MEINVACRSGAVYKVPYIKTYCGQINLISKDDLPENEKVFAAFSDELGSFQIKETGKLLEVIPTQEISQSWYFPDKKEG